MGLDTVEILMEIEGEFEISIPDQVASNSLTVGDTHRIIVDMLVAKERRGRQSWTPMLGSDS